MKNRSKALLLALCAMMLVVATVFGTMAYLTDTKTVTNTFTVGNVKLKLDETNTKPDGTPVTGEKAGRLEEGNEYKLMPGHTYTKDPMVTVLAGSEDCYVRMIVEVKNIDKLKAALPQSAYGDYYAGDTFLLEKLCVDETNTCTWDSTEWEFEEYKPTTETVEEGKDEKTIQCGLYEFRYVGTANDIVANATTNTELESLFEKITVPGSVNSEHLEYLKDVKIVVTAHAIQADGFAGADAAWNAFAASN